MSNIDNQLKLNEHKEQPKIYAYSDIQWQGQLKIGYTTRDVKTRVKEQYPVKTPERTYTIGLIEDAIRSDGSTFIDKDVHKWLKDKGFVNTNGEWFRCTYKDVKSAINAIKYKKIDNANRCNDFKMRPEQENAVNKTIAYFTNLKNEDPNHSSKFLWNCKMRFGKTFATYQLAKKMNFKKILVLTFKPAVVSAWKSDLETHIDFDKWQFICKDNQKDFENLDFNNPVVCFGSFQDFLQLDKKTNCIKSKNKWIHETQWDLVVIDEYHFGAWRQSAKNLFKSFNEEELISDKKESICTQSELEENNINNEIILPITVNNYLYLSGTPFRALSNGEFIEEQIFNWTYTDEQREKNNWIGENNPYAALPEMVIMCYKLPDEVRKIALKGEFNEFDLNTFFSAERKNKVAVFKFKDEVQKWLDIMRGSYKSGIENDLKLGSNKAEMPYSNSKMLKVLQNTLWFLPNVAACEAMESLLKEPQNRFYQDYKIILCAGKHVGSGKDALIQVEKAMNNPLESKTITLTCGKLTTGVTVKPWTGILMLRGLSTPESYFQAAFRVQSPWEIKDENYKNLIIKEKCFVFDFSLNRALKQISEYGMKLSVDKEKYDPNTQINDLISFLPVIAYDGSTMTRMNADEILEHTICETTSSLLARKWQTPLLVHIDDDTLNRLINNQQAIEILSNIEEFRTVKNDIETIITKSNEIKQLQKYLSVKDECDKSEKTELDKKRKETKSKRKKFQDKLIKLITRIPIFMYLTDYREECLKDVIMKIEPELFKKVTGISLSDFETLLDLNLFNNSLMNEAIFSFKRYENHSLEYMGIKSRKVSSKIGGWDYAKEVNDN